MSVSVMRRADKDTFCSSSVLTLATKDTSHKPSVMMLRISSIPKSQRHSSPTAIKQSIRGPDVNSSLSLRRHRVSSYFYSEQQTPTNAMCSTGLLKLG